MNDVDKAKIVIYPDFAKIKIQLPGFYITFP